MMFLYSKQCCNQDYHDEECSTNLSYPFLYSNITQGDGDSLASVFH